jgi:catechol 2,3-dioxygenase-like lactoylglutathione lyase family enzyme
MTSLIWLPSSPPSESCVSIRIGARLRRRFSFGWSASAGRGPLASGASRARLGRMAIQLNHTIVSARDPRASAAFLAEILGLAAPVRFGVFHGVQVDNGVTLDFMRSGDKPVPQHYAFLVSEAQFDEIFDRIRGRQLPFWADPGHQGPGEINRRDGGRGVYWDDPDGHVLEIITRPYGSGSSL